eukprot:TRINITY_DN24644_c0_g1_i1.p1 TRINITY_DN24644_c0_g1~~TRINITY_DN24644_c0_g1_i1.p1  ORF type:complete len:218 (+),score=89.62 TRINITY_DN24644_c0_g1_i1:59-712(+)
MQRLFGKGPAKKAAPAPTLGDTQERMDKNIGNSDARVAKIDEDLGKIRDQMKRAKPGTPAHNRLKQRGMQLLKQKRMYEGQRDQMENQRFALDQMAFTQESMQSTMDHVNCLKETATSMKAQQKNFDISKIEDMQDDLQDIYDDNQEIQEILGRNYGLEEDIDDDDLEAELAGLEDDLLANNDASYLDEALAPPTTSLPAVAQDETDPSRLEEQLGL